MAKPGLLLIEQSNGWNLIGLGRKSVFQLCSGLDHAELAQKTFDFCQTNSLDSRRVLLAVATDSVFATKVSPAILPQLKTNEALRFHLESSLPLDAESMVADLLVSSPRGLVPETPLAVAMEINAFESLVAELELKKVMIQAIVPYAMLVLQQACVDRTIPMPSITLWPENVAEGTSTVTSRIGVVRIDMDGHLTDWQLVEREGNSLMTLFRIWGCDSAKAIWINTDDTSVETTEVSPEPQVRRMQVQPTQLACKAASAILNRSANPWVDLRRDRIAAAEPLRRHRASVHRMVYVAIGTLLLFGCCLGWLTYRYKSASQQFEQRQRDVFASAFPDQKIPAGIMTRMRSELAKAKAVRSTDKSIDVSIRALPILHRTLSSLPTDLPLELNEVRVENGRIVLELSLSDQKDVGAVASALAGAGFEVEPPATSLVDGGKIQTTVIAELQRVGLK